MNLSISSARCKVLDLEVLHEKDGKAAAGEVRSAQSRVSGSWYLTPLAPLLSPFYIRLFLPLPRSHLSDYNCGSCFTSTCRGNFLRPMRASELHSCKISPRFDHHFSEEMWCLTHFGCSIELRREALKGTPSANEGLAPP
jgi:hypothetical protein